MDAKQSVEEGIADVIRTYELLDRARTGRDIIIRDDQFDPEALLDAARLSRSRRFRMGVLDTGRFDTAGLDRLLREGVRLLTSDEARPSGRELGLVLESALKAGTSVAYFLNGPLPAEAAPSETGTPAEAGRLGASPRSGGATEAAGESPASGGDSASVTGISALDFRFLIRDGLDVHISNAAASRDLAVLADLADSGAPGKGFFVYYHHGPIEEGLPFLASRRAWIHLSDRSLHEAEAVASAAAAARAAHASGSRTIVHVDDGLALDPLSRLFAARAVVLFHTAPSDYRSRLRPYEARAARQKLPARASYLTTALMP